MNNALLYLGGLLITALAVLFAVPRFVDWNSYRGVFEEEASRILGREVRVGGDVNLRLLPAPFVSFEKLRIADVGDGGGNSIIRVESFTMWLSVPPLLRGVLEAHKVELRRPVLSLATNAEGSGNWRSLAVSPGSLSFAPKDVSLQSVAIQDGAVIVSGPSQTELARFEDINGELTAEALEGPYKFKGGVSWDGALRQLRFATAKVDDQGVVRFKAAVDVTGSANSYVLDAKLSDLKGVPTLEGDLTAKLDLGTGAMPAPATTPEEIALSPEPTAPQGTGPALPAAPATPDGPKPFELKAKVKGTALGVALDDIAVSLEAGATPQLITGQAKIGWADKTQLDVNLSSRWLDLDQLTKTSAGKVPLEAARSYFEVLAAALPQKADTNALLEFDQLTLGGEPISNVRLAASRSGGPLELKGVRATLPGGARFELDGVLTPAENVPRLDGTIFVSGKSLVRFLSWGLGAANVGRSNSDGPFSLDGHFALGDGTLSLTDATVEMSGTPLEGDLELKLGERRQVNVSIDGQRIDVAQFGSGLVDLANLRGMLFGSGAPASAAPESKTQAGVFDPASGDLRLDLKVAELVDGERLLKDVDADIRLEQGRLSIPRLKFATPEGLYVEAEGDATDVPAHPKGSVRGLVSAPSADAARAFFTLLSSEDLSAGDLDRFAGLAPFRLAGTLNLSGGATNASTLAVDGTLGGGKLSAALRLDGGSANWRTSPMDLTATIDSPDAAKLVATLFGGKVSRKATQPVRGRAVIKASGVPADGLLGFADVSGDNLTLGYRGHVRAAKPGETDLDGELRIAAPDARIGLALAGLNVADGAAGVPINGTIDLNRKSGALNLESEALTLGDSKLSGRVALTSSEGGRTSVDAKVTADKASFSTLLAPMLGAASTEGIDPLAPPVPQLASAPPAVIWPEQSFDLSLLDRVDGKISLTAASLLLEQGLTVGNAELDIQLAPDSVKVTRLRGDAVGGKLNAEFNVGRAPAGISLDGKLRIDLGNNTASASAKADPPVGDAVAFNVNFSSRALSPAAIIAAATGKGELTVSDATLNGNSPVAVSAVARAALTGQGPSSGNQLSEAVKTAIKDGAVQLGKLAVPVEISDGALKLGKVQIDMTEGRSTFQTAVELTTMKIDSEWQIAPKLDKGLAVNADRALLPPVTVVYAGKLNAFDSLEPQVSTASLERELVVRKLELDVGELERLRKVDEERARQEAVRRKADDEERARIEAERRKALEDDRPDAVHREELSAPPAAGPGTNSSSSDVYDQSVVDAPQGVPIEKDLEAQAPPPTAAAPAPERPRPRRKPPPTYWNPFQQLTPY
jgi:uncharacterized protein involved in outer membrane biogenesis